MNKKGTHDSSKRAGLSVRYCFDGQIEEQDEGGSSGDESEDISELSQAPSTNRVRKPPHHLPRTNHWFQAGGAGKDLKRRVGLNSDRFKRRNSYNLAAGDEIGRRDWQGEDEKDPGFFLTDKVKQPSKEDLLSWDSSCCSSSSSDDDIRDSVGGNNRARSGSAGGYSTGGGRAASACDSAVVSRTMWGSARPPVPPTAAVVGNVSANKADDPNTDSAGGAGGSKKTVENTYRLEPKAGTGFVWFKMKRPMVSIVDQMLDEFAYNVKSGPAVTRRLCEIIMKMAKKTFEWPRYKYVCSVALAQLKHQGIMIADRALWNTQVDNVASYVYKTKTLLCVVTFHALYFE